MQDCGSVMKTKIMAAGAGLALFTALSFAGPKNTGPADSAKAGRNVETVSSQEMEDRSDALGKAVACAIAAAACAGAAAGIARLGRKE